MLMLWRHGLFSLRDLQCQVLQEAANRKEFRKVMQAL
jgi:hypothetical protein